MIKERVSEPGTIPSEVAAANLSKPPTTIYTKPPRTPTKIVILKCYNGQWEAELELLDVKAPFTQRDFNQIERVMLFKTAETRRKAGMAYHKALREQKSPKPEVKSV